MGIKKDQQQFTLYMPKPIWRKTAKIAKEERMSMTNFIIKSLENLFKEKYDK